jgi:hypothetical protein
MEKKGNPLNQLAIVSDLLEKINLNVESTILVLTLNKDEFEKIFDMVQKKQNTTIERPDNTFQLKIGEVEIFFNMSNA